MPGPGVSPTTDCRLSDTIYIYPCLQLWQHVVYAICHLDKLVAYSHLGPDVATTDAAEILYSRPPPPISTIYMTAMYKRDVDLYAVGATDVHAKIYNDSDSNLI